MIHVQRVRSKKIVSALKIRFTIRQCARVKSSKQLTY